MKELELHQKMVAEDLLSDEDYNMIDDSEALGEPSQNPVLPSTSSEAISTPERITLMKDVRVTVKRIEEDPAVKKLASNIQERRAAEDVVNTSFDDPLGSLGTQSETPAFHEQVSLDQVLQQFKDDEFRSTLETVNELKKEIEFLKETHSSEIMSLKDEIGRLMIERDQAIADAKDRAEQITAIKHQYEEQMKSTKERFEEELANVTTEKKGQIESVERDCEQKIEEIRNEHQETLQSIEAMYKVQIDVMESEGKKLAEKKVDDIRVEYEKNIEEIKKEYQERMESMETHYKEKVEATKKEGKEQINREVEGVREEYTQQIQTLKQGHEEQIQLIREECQRDIHTNKKKQWVISP